MRLLQMLCVLLLLSACSTDDFELIAFKDGEKWGFVNWEGEIVINPQFSEAHNFSEGLAVVANKSGEFGYVDEEGSIVISQQYLEATGFKEGKAWVVEKGEAPACIDKNGEVLFTCDFCDLVCPYYDGLALYREETKDGEKIYGFLNADGTIAIPATYDGAGFFVEGLAKVENEDGEIGFINKEGTLVIPYQFESTSWFDQYGSQTCIAGDGEEAGVIDVKGKYVINPQFDNMWIWKRNYIVEVDDEYGVVDAQGKYLINPQFEKLAAGFESTVLTYLEDEEYGFCDAKGKTVIVPQFEDAYPFYRDKCFVKAKRGWGIIDLEGKYVANPQFDAVRANPQLIGSYYVENRAIDIQAVQEDLGPVFKLAFGQRGIGEILETYGKSKESFMSGYGGQMVKITGYESLGEGLYITQLQINNEDLFRRQTITRGRYYTWTETVKTLREDAVPADLKVAVGFSGKLNNQADVVFSKVVIPYLKSAYPSAKIVKKEKKGMELEYAGRKITIAVLDDTLLFTRS